MKKLLLFALAFVSTCAFSQTQKQCDSSFCSGLGPPVGICTPGTKYTQVVSTGNAPTLWQCGGIPPTWQVQASGGGAPPSPPAFSVQAANNPTSTLTSDNSVQINKQFHQQVEKLPRTDILHSDFGVAASCANPADPTFNPSNPNASQDSTCALQAAINYIQSAPVTPHTPGILYIPQGNYKISSALRITKSIVVRGDSNGGTILTNVSTSNNLITVFNPISVGNAGSLYDGVTLSDLTLSGSGHLTKGTLLEVDYGINFTSYNLTLTNSGGRGMALNFSAERSRNYNMQISAVRWPLTQAGNANEDQWWGALIISPGATYDNYIFNENAPNGVYLGPNLGPISTNVWTAATWFPGGYILTDGLGKNWQAQAPGTTAASTPAWASFPTDGQTIVDGGVTWKNISNRTLVVPTNHTAIHLEGENNLFSGSVKSIQFISGISMCSENCTVMNSYFEGFTGSPNHAVLTVNYPEHFPGTGTLASAGTQVTIGNLDWVVDFVNAPTDASFGNGANDGVYVLMPNDYDTQISTPSADVPGINRNQFEVVQVKGVDGTGNMYIAARNFNGSTAPAGTAWPANQWFAVRGVFGSQVGTGPTFKNSHFNALDPPLAGYAYNCQDNQPTICAEFIGGILPDGQYINGLTKPSNPLVSLLGNRQFSLDHDTATGNSNLGEYLGTGSLKIPVNGAFDISQTPAFSGAFTSNLPMLTGAHIGAFGTIYAVAWSPAFAGNTEVMNNSNTFMHNSGSTSGTQQSKYQIVQTSDFNQSTLTAQVNNGFCYADSNTTTQPTFRFCFEGGPSLSPLIKTETWNGTAWVPVFSVNSSGSLLLNGVAVKTAFSGQFTAVATTNPQTFTLAGVTASSVCSLTPGNAPAASDLARAITGGAADYITPGAGTVTVTFGSAPSLGTGKYNVTCQ